MSVMRPEGGLEVLDLTDVVGDIEIPCDWGETVKGVVHSAARWVAFRVKCECGFGGGPRLICDPCKVMIMETDTAMQCAGKCGAIYAPCRRIISSIEPLDRRG